VDIATRLPGITIRQAISCGPFRAREIAYAPGLRQRQHSHPLTGVTLVLAGAIRESASSREEVGSALSVVVKPAGLEHADDVGPHGARTLQLAFDPSSLGDLAEQAGDLDRWRWLHGRPVAAALLTLLRLLRGSSSCLAEDAIVDALAAVPDDPPLTGEPPAWLRIAREALDDDLHRSPPVRDLARAAGTHPVSLSRAFRRHFGCTITEYRRRERLRRAASAIAGTRESLSRVAHSAGYADHPHLCREFRVAMGLSPSDFRDLSRAG
jgi:AraC family transcriptional regulator